MAFISKSHVSSWKGEGYASLFVYRPTKKLHSAPLSKSTKVLAAKCIKSIKVKVLIRQNDPCLLCKQHFLLELVKIKLMFYANSI